MGVEVGPLVTRFRGAMAALGAEPRCGGRSGGHDRHRAGIGIAGPRTERFLLSGQRLSIRLSR